MRRICPSAGEKVSARSEYDRREGVVTVAISWEISVRLRNGGKGLMSPNYADEETAKKDLELISNAQKEGEHVDLPWLSTNGADIISAQVVTKPGSPGIAFRS